MNVPVIVQKDQWLSAYVDVINRRLYNIYNKEKALTGDKKRLKDFATGHLYYGLHKNTDSWIFREWAPNANEIYMIGDFSDWKPISKYALKRLQYGNWEINLPNDALKHKQFYKLLVKWQGGEALRLPSYGNRMVQDPQTLIFSCQIWNPEQTYQWKCTDFKRNNDPPLIYEAHIGMSSPDEKVASFNEFRLNMIPYIKKAGYNTIQLMAIQEHPYYGSFGYHVSNFFAVSSRFGTPDELKELIDAAHSEKIAVIMDLVHSHSVKNEDEGLAVFDGTPYQYFHDGGRRNHIAWDSLCFNYNKNEVLHFLLSNCQYWLEEYKFDGFRFDGITSMIYLNHGLGQDFTNYNMYYDGNQDEDAITYLGLANKLIHEINPQALSVAEEMSGMPGIASPLDHGGYGFDYRLAMGVPDFWIKLLKEQKDEDWNVSHMYHELSSHRADEKTISYAESHDQALVGDKTISFRLMDKEMYFSMNKNIQNLIIDRGIALHKLIRLITLATSGGGYLNFMGNEFGHPEWIDFPRAGNNWSYKYARRQWNLLTNDLLRYRFLAEFDREMIYAILQNNCLSSSFPKMINADEQNHVLIFERSGILFIFNFNPNQSFTDYRISVDAGKYTVIFHSDKQSFGGFNRVDTDIVYYTTNNGQIPTSMGNYLSIYIPNRTAIVLKKIPSKSIYDTK